MRDDYLKYIEEEKLRYGEGEDTVSVLERPSQRIEERRILDPVDEPTPEIRDGCCCPCPAPLSAIPFVAFGPLQ